MFRGSREQMQTYRRCALYRDERGAAVVEFALVLPLLLMLIFGIVSFGTIAFVNSNMLNAARDAARVLAVKNNTSAQALAQAQGELAIGVLSYAINVCTAGGGCTCTPSGGGTCTIPDPRSDTANDVAVTVSVPMGQAAIVDWLGIFQSKTLSATVVMYKEK